jgi:hypothetical protein
MILYIAYGYYSYKDIYNTKGISTGDYDCVIHTEYHLEKESTWYKWYVCLRKGMYNTHGI